MWVIRMGIRRVVVVMIMVMIVTMMMMVVVIMLRLKSAKPGAERITQGAIRDVGPGRIGTLPFDVVMMAFLNGTDLSFEPKDLCPVFT